MAILGFADGKLIRYFHNGQLPSKHDQGMFAVGDYKFKHVADSHKPSLRKQRKDARRGTIYPNHEIRGIRTGIMFHPGSGLAAQMRRGWEVEAD